MDNITPPLNFVIPPEGRGVIQEGVEGDPPFIGGTYIFLYGTPPYVTSTINMSIYVSFINTNI